MPADRIIVACRNRRNSLCMGKLVRGANSRTWHLQPRRERPWQKRGCSQWFRSTRVRLSNLLILWTGVLLFGPDASCLLRFRISLGLKNLAAQNEPVEGVSKWLSKTGRTSLSLSEIRFSDFTGSHANDDGWWWFEIWWWQPALLFFNTSHLLDQTIGDAI